MPTEPKLVGSFSFALHLSLTPCKIVHPYSCYVLTIFRPIKPIMLIHFPLFTDFATSDDVDIQFSEKVSVIYF